MQGPHHGQRGRGASEYPGGVSQLIHQVRLPSPADVESCLISSAVFPDTYSQTGLLRLSWANVAAILCSALGQGSPLST